jgi:uncharacterized protein
MADSRKLFINVRVRDLRTSVAFFAALGFRFNPLFTDANAACMIVSEQVAFMLLNDATFREHTDREPCETLLHTEAMYSLTCDSRDGVDQLVDLAMEHGATRAMPTQDFPYMYARSFRCPDGHHFEAVCMLPAPYQPSRSWERRGALQLAAGD